MEAKFKNINDEDILELFKAKLKYHQDFVQKYKRLIDTYNGVVGKENIGLFNIYDNSLSRINGFNQKEKRDFTFEDHIIGMFDDGQPKTTKMLFDGYNQLGLKPVSVKDFSSKLSMRAKSGGKLKNLKLDQYELINRYWWGLADWFDGNDFKDEYLTKIHNRMLF